MNTKTIICSTILFLFLLSICKKYSTIEFMENVNLNINDIIADKKQKYNNHNINLSTIMKINKNILNKLNNKLFDMDLKIINKNSKVKDIKTIHMIKNISTTLYGFKNQMIKTQQVREKILNIIDSIYLKLNGKVTCNIKDFIIFCKKGVVKTNKEKFSNIEDDIRSLNIDYYHAKKGKIIEKFGENKISTNFKRISMKDTLSSFTKTKNIILLDLIDIFKDKYKREYNIFSKSDLVNLVIIFIEDLKKNLKELKSLLKTKKNRKRLKLLIKIFIPKRNLFYQLKHHYKILSIYLLFDKLIEGDDKKIIAGQCCASIHKGNKCYNFGKSLNKSNPLVYGYSKYGYVKESKCVSADYYNKTVSSIILENFDRPISFDKKKLLDNVYSMLSYYKVINNTSSVLTLSNINLSELIKFKVILETDTNDNIFYSLSNKIAKEMLLIKKKKIYNQEKKIREEKNRILINEQLLFDIKEKQKRMDNMDKIRKERETRVKRNLLIMEEESISREINREKKVRMENLYFEEENILMNKRDLDRKKRRATKALILNDERYQEAINKTLRKETIERKRKETENKRKKSAIKKARLEAKEKNKRLKLKARVHKQIITKTTGPLSKKRKLINKIKVLFKKMKQDMSNKKKYIVQIKLINKQIKNL